MEPEVLLTIELNASRLLTEYQSQSARLTFARDLEECLANERQKIMDLRQLYAAEFDEIVYLSIDYFEDHDRFIRRQEIGGRYLRRHCAEYYFVSHRWMTGSDPDPDGERFREVKRRLAELSPTLREGFGVWFDFSCIPQRGTEGAMTYREEQEFARALKVMHLLPAMSFTLCFLEPEYLDRTWCLAEWACATRISPVASNVADVPFSNQVKFIQLALMISFISCPPEIQRLTLEGDDHASVSMLNALLAKTFASSETTIASDRALIFEIMHRHIWYHVRYLGLRSQIMIALLRLRQLRDSQIKDLLRHFLFISEDPEASWTKDYLLHVDTMVLTDADEFNDASFAKAEVDILSRSNFRDSDP